MEILEKVILMLILITVIGLSFVIFIVFSDSGDSTTTTTKESKSNASSDSGASSDSEASSDSGASTGNSYGTDLNTRSTDYDTDNIDLENAFEEGELVYCLTNTNNCEKMDAITCDENHIETYATEENCLSAKAIRSGSDEGSNRWCYIDSECVKVHQDQVNTTCTGPKFNFEEECDAAANTKYCYDASTNQCSSINIAMGHTCEDQYTFDTSLQCSNYKN